MELIEAYELIFFFTFIYQLSGFLESKSCTVDSVDPTTAQETDSPSRNKAAELAFRSPSNFRQGHCLATSELCTVCFHVCSF